MTWVGKKYQIFLFYFDTIYVSPNSSGWAESRLRFITKRREVIMVDNSWHALAA
jgi:hypothetical protein